MMNIEAVSGFLWTAVIHPANTGHHIPNTNSHNKSHKMSVKWKDKSIPVIGHGGL
jgi:hypothetical protein